MRLGVEAALVEGRLLPGDVAIDDGRIRPSASTASAAGSPCPASSTCR